MISVTLPTDLVPRFILSYFVEDSMAMVMLDFKCSLSRTGLARMYSYLSSVHTRLFRMCFAISACFDWKPGALSRELPANLYQFTRVSALRTAEASDECARGSNCAVTLSDLVETGGKSPLAQQQLF